MVEDFYGEHGNLMGGKILVRTDRAGSLRGVPAPSGLVVNPVLHLVFAAGAQGTVYSVDLREEVLGTSTGH